MLSQSDSAGRLDITIYLQTITLLVAVLGVALAFLAYRIRTRRHHIDSLLKTIDRLETIELRALRKSLYALERDGHEGWSLKARSDVHSWSAELDIISLLISGRDINRRAVFLLYGDVIIRSIWLLSPYFNAQRQSRGRQFALPIGMLYPIIISQWETEVRRSRYPDEIGWPGNSRRISLQSFRNDEACRRLSAENFKGARRVFQK